MGELQRRYGSVEACRDAVAQLRWPSGFVCPECDNTTFSVCCAAAGYTSATAAAVRPRCRPARCSPPPNCPCPHGFWPCTWCPKARKGCRRGMSSLELARHLGVSQNTAWAIRHKLMQALLEGHSGRQLRGLSEVDDAYVGGRRRGAKRGRGSPNKTPMVAAVATQAGRPTQLKLSRIKSFHCREVERWSRHHVRAEAEVLSDALAWGPSPAGHPGLPLSREAGSGFQGAAFECAGETFGQGPEQSVGRAHETTGRCRTSGESEKSRAINPLFLSGISSGNQGIRYGQR